MWAAVHEKPGADPNRPPRLSPSGRSPSQWRRANTASSGSSTTTWVDPLRDGGNPAPSWGFCRRTENVQTEPTLGGFQQPKMDIRRQSTRIQHRRLLKGFNMLVGSGGRT